MRVIIDERAWRDLDDIATRIGRDNPGAVRREIAKIRHVIGLLIDFSGVARAGRAQGTYERVVPRSRYVIVFERSDAPPSLIITAIVHSARNR